MILITDILQVLMPWKFNGCHALFVIDHVKKHVTFIDFTPTQVWCKHMPYKRFAEAIIMASKKYKIAYSKKRSGWAEDICRRFETGGPSGRRVSAACPSPDGSSAWASTKGGEERGSRSPA
jgi:hypothetical protein